MSKKIPTVQNDAPLGRDLLGQNGAVSPESRIIGGSIQDLPPQAGQAKNGGEKFQYVDPELESLETEDGHAPEGSKHFNSNGASDQYGGPTEQCTSPEPEEARLDYTGSNGETRREVNRHAVEGIQPTPEQARGTPPPVK